MSPTADTASVDLLLPIMDMPLFFFFSNVVDFEEEEEAAGVGPVAATTPPLSRGVLGLLPLLLAEDVELASGDFGGGSTVAVVTVSPFLPAPPHSCAATASPLLQGTFSRC